MENEEFIVHGTMQTSNFGGWEVMLSDCGDSARVRDNYAQPVDKLIASDWIEIEYIEEEDSDDEELIAIINYNGSIIPLNQVIKV